MTFYSEMAGVSEELLAEFGQIVVIQYTTRGPYDPSSGIAAADTFSEWTAKGAEFDFSAGMSGVRFQAGTVIELGDRHLLLSPRGLSGAPKVGAIALLRGRTETWKIIAVKELNPSGEEPLLFECLLRR